MRSCGGALALVLASGNVPLYQIDLYTVVLADGTTTYRWAAFDKDVVYAGDTFSAAGPYINRSKWNVVNTLEVPTLDVFLLAGNDSFAGGGNVKLQAHNGLFDGSYIMLDRLFCPIPEDPHEPIDTVIFGTVHLFTGDGGKVTVSGNKVQLAFKGKVNRLDRNAPHNIYQATCIHNFCDTGCTLDAADFTDPYTMGGTPTKTFIPWASAPGTEDRFRLGTVRVTSGPASGETRQIRAATSSGLTLSYPLYGLPVAGNTFTAMEGCDKSIVRCTALSNEANYRAFEFVPPAEFGY